MPTTGKTNKGGHYEKNISIISCGGNIHNLRIV